MLYNSRHGFPVFLAGTCDKNNTFHPTYLALASHEDETCFAAFFEVIAQGGYSPTHIMADGAYSITNASTRVYPTAKRLMCWAHVIKNVDKKLGGMSKAQKKGIRQEIEKLQYARNDDQFRRGKHSLSNLFIFLFSLGAFVG
jgi:hypothetical protein